MNRVFRNSALLVTTGQIAQRFQVANCSNYRSPAQTRPDHDAPNGRPAHAVIVCLVGQRHEHRFLRCTDLKLPTLPHDANAHDQCLSLRPPTGQDQARETAHADQFLPDISLADQIDHFGVST